MPLTATAAAASAGVAVWLVLARRPGRRLPTARARSAFRVRPVTTAGPAVALAVLAGALLVVVDGTALALGLVLLAGLAGAARLIARTRARRLAQQRADAVVEVCEALAGELRSGQPPLRALRHCVAVWPVLEPVASAGELGGDVPRALHKLASLEGASGLHDLASAWQVSQGSGGAMALALARVADSTRRRRATERLVASELASAQATARLVAVLPVVVLAMGSGLGGNPWAFLLTTPAGVACLALGLLLAYGGLAWIDRIAATVVDP